MRLGLIGVNTSHADAFSRIFNGDETTPPAIDEADITAIWGGDPGRVRDVAARHRIGTVVEQPQDMMGKVDGVLVIDDTGLGEAHASLAWPFLEAGIPAFIDKPMTTRYGDAVELFEVAARTGTPVLSCSALRFAAELETARANLARIGRLSSVTSVGPGVWFNYGVHAVELLGAVVGTGANSVHRHAFDQRDVAVITFLNGPVAVVETLRDAAFTFHLTAYGEHGHTAFEVRDGTAFYTNTMREVVRMIESGTAPLRPEQTLEVLAILHAGERSASAHQTVDLAAVRDTHHPR
jgi:predicted dehydrogenase